MKKSQNNRLKMYLTVRLIHQEFASLIANVPALEQAVSTFDELIEQIKLTRMAQENDNTGYRERRVRLRSLMQERAVIISNAVFAYAYKIEDEVLAQSVHVVPSDFSNISEQKAHSICCAIFNHANSLTSALSNYGIDAADLSDYETLISTFATTMVDSRQAKTKSRNATIHLAQLFTKVNRLLRSMIDKLMFLYKLSHPAFFNRYFIAREIIEYGVRHLTKNENGNGKQEKDGENEASTEEENSQDEKPIVSIEEGREEILSENTK